jgi:hypothetical protein
MAEKKITSKITRERIRLMETPLSPEGLIEGFRALGDANGHPSQTARQISS